MGAIGISVTGAFIFNDLSSPAGDLAVPQEGESLDNCCAHTSPFKDYHYHSNMNCTTSPSLKAKIEDGEK